MKSDTSSPEDEEDLLSIDQQDLDEVVPPAQSTSQYLEKRVVSVTLSELKKRSVHLKRWMKKISVEIALRDQKLEKSLMLIMDEMRSIKEQTLKK